ncbi:MAG: hypothetical protein ACXWKN_01830 [Phenylobacterium sp.]
MRGRLAWLGFALASLICAWGAYSNGSQLITILTFIGKVDAAVPAAVWVITGLWAVHTIGVCAGWWVGYLGMTNGRYRQAVIGTGVALVASTPLLILLFRKFSVG